MNILPAYERLHEILSYEPETGHLRWKFKRGPSRAGGIAGGPSDHGYVAVRIDGKLYRAHRIIWKMMTGADPLDILDHKDLNRANNAWNNLRQADNSKNLMNAGLPRHNTSGVKGVFWDAHAGKWRARIKLNQKQHHIGVFDSIEDAAKEVQTARERLHGEFARAA